MPKCCQLRKVNEQKWTNQLKWTNRCYFGLVYINKATGKHCSPGHRCNHKSNNIYKLDDISKSTKLRAVRVLFRDSHHATTVAPISAARFQKAFERTNIICNVYKHRRPHTKRLYGTPKPVIRPACYQGGEQINRDIMSKYDNH